MGSLCATTVGMLTATVLTLGAGQALRADEPSTGRLTLAAERVVVFKDGYGLIVKRATATADAQGRVHTDQVPPGAVLGCLWTATAAGAPLVSALRAEWIESKDTVQREVTSASILELLRANVGRKVVLGRVGEAQPDLEVTLLEVLEPTPPLKEEPAERSEDARRSARLVLAAAGVSEAVTHVLVGRGAERLVLPLASIHTVRGEGLLTKRKRTDLRIKREKRLSIEFGPEQAGKAVECRLLYFTTGLRWIPTYRLSGALLDVGELDLQAEILNEVEDLVDAQWSLVVGVPHFRFKEEPSPLALESTLRNLISHADGQQALQTQMSNMVRNDFVNPGEGEDSGSSGLRTAPGLAATGEQDLFVYGVGTRSLARGARAALPLWTASVPLRHVYTYEVHGGLGARDGAAPARRVAGPNELERNAVWHQLELTNGKDVPWTTGPALILREQLPVGQDILAYTPKGASTLLPVTVAVDVRGSYREEERGRDANSLSWGGSSYARIRRHAFVTLTNHRSEPSVVRVTLSLVGQAEAPSDEGRVRLEIADDVNSRSEVRWDLTLAAGASKTVECDVSFFVR